MLRTSSDQKQPWGPEADAVLKKAEEEPQDDDQDNRQDASTATQDATSGAQDFVAVRVSRSQSLTVPKTPPMFVSPTNSSTSINNSPSADFTETTTGTLAQPLSEPDRTTAATATTNGVTQRAHQNPPPLVSPQQLANDPRFARRNRRSMSAEFTLSMLQQELGYPKRKYSKSRRDSVEKSRRTSSILEEESQDSDSNSATATTTTAAVKSSDGGVLSNPRSEDATTISSSSNEPHSNNTEPEPERMSRLSIESASKYPSANSSTKRGSYSSTHDCDTNDDEDNDLNHNEDEEEEEENFLDSRVASITGFSQDTDGVVYYEIIVKSTAHGPLSAYKVRRRYSEFRDLHRTLSKVMPTTRRVSFDSPPGFSDDDEHAEGFLSSFQQTPPPPAARGARERDWGYLPPMPDRGGVWSYFQFDTTPFLERRAKYFQALLVACQSHPRARESRLLNEFLGPPPDSVALHTSVENSYVSLNRFAAPKLRLSVEAQERKQKARNISRRRSSVHRASRPSEP